MGMRMVDFVQNTLDGVMIGSSYGLLALGFTLIFGVMRRLNLSYGPSIMVGAYLGTLVYVQLSAGPIVVIAVTVLGAVLAGLYVERLCFAPMASTRAGIASMVSSFAIWMQLEQAAILALPRHTYPFPPLATGNPLTLGPFLLRVDHLIMLACAFALATYVQLLIYRSRFGLALRAIIDNPTAAHLVGIDVKTAVVLAFALASAVGGIAGYLVLATNQQVTPMFGMWATFKGLIAMMIGGLGSIPGAILGGLVLGIVEAHSQWYFGPQVRDLCAYVLLFACLVLRPGGLLGEMPSREPATGRRGA
jgi:branched-subunit amino acid ABC-type transport system permease component